MQTTSRASLPMLLATLIGLVALLPAGPAQAGEAITSPAGRFSIGLSTGLASAIDYEIGPQPPHYRVGLTSRYYFSDRFTLQSQLGFGSQNDDQYLSLSSSALYLVPLHESPSLRFDLHAGGGLVVGMGLEEEHYTQVSGLAVAGLDLLLKEPGVEIALNAGPGLIVGYLYPEVAVGITGEGWLFAGVNIRKFF